MGMGGLGNLCVIFPETGTILLIFRVFEGFYLLHIKSNLFFVDNFIIIYNYPHFPGNQGSDLFCYSHGILNLFI